MKKHFLLICSLFIVLTGKSQPVAYSYYLDTDLNSVEKSKATIFGNGVKEKGLFRLDCYSVQGGKLLMTIHFKDSSLADLEGPYVSYHNNGRPDKEGVFKNGIEEGAWLTRNIYGYALDSIIYKKGIPMVTATYSYHKNGIVRRETQKDSLQDTYSIRTYDPDSKPTNEVFFKGQKGTVKTYTGDAVQTDSVFTREEKAAEFPGADAGWSEYLKKNLDVFTPDRNNAPKGLYIVVVAFTINTDGSIEQVEAETNFGYGMEAEVVRVIKNGPGWIPATQYGRKIRSIRKQPVTFSVK